MKNYILILCFLLFVGCSDDSQVFIYDKSILDKKIGCLRLTVFPPNKMISETLENLYDFKQKCDYNLIISYKTGIVCNSNQNSDKKVVGLPKSYLRMELKQHRALSYTYYKDLQNNVSKDDVVDGFNKLNEDLKF